jgi:hypothetical protein
MSNAHRLSVKIEADMSGLQAGMNRAADHWRPLDAGPYRRRAGRGTADRGAVVQ